MKSPAWHEDQAGDFFIYERLCLFMNDYEQLIKTDFTSIDLQIITLLQEEFD